MRLKLALLAGLQLVIVAAAYAAPQAQPGATPNLPTVNLPVSSAPFSVTPDHDEILMPAGVATINGEPNFTIHRGETWNFTAIQTGWSAVEASPEPTPTAT